MSEEVDEREELARPAQQHLPLLTMITQQALDEDYLVAAGRRVAGVPRGPKGRSRRVAAVVITAFGVLVSTAFVQTARNSDVDTAGRASLVTRIENGRDLLALQQQRVADLRASNIELESSLGELSDVEQEALVRNRRLQVRTGFIAVSGPGVRVVVTDRPDADAGDLVQDSDLALLVNGLWEAGAEAVSVNGQRITARSAIRTSGQAIEVNERGIAGPYTVEAIGDTRTLSARLFDTTSGLVFAGNADIYGFTYPVENVAQLDLPSGPPTLLTPRLASTDMNDPDVDGPSRAQPDTDPDPDPESEERTS